MRPIASPAGLGARLASPALVLAAGVACFLVLSMGWADAAQAGRPPRQAPAPAADAVGAGRSLYVVHCSSCHGFDAGGTRDGPSLVHSGASAADFYLRTGRMPLNDPKQQAVRHRPAFDQTQIDQIVAYIASLDAGPPIPVLHPGNLADGNQLFSINCAQCHNDAGAGGALGYGDIVPSLRNSGRLDVFEAARIGPKPMPVFGPDTLSDQQVSDIATYVQYLHHPEDRGGFGLGHLGPIPEGFVGWVVGIGALLLVTRLIGTRG